MTAEAYNWNKFGLAVAPSHRGFEELREVALSTTSALRLRESEAQSHAGQTNVHPGNIRLDPKARGPLNWK